MVGQDNKSLPSAISVSTREDLESASTFNSRDLLSQFGSGKTPKLEDILNGSRGYPIDKDSFRIFLADRNLERNIDFYDDVSAFKATMPNPSPSMEEIASLYLEHGAEKQLNINEKKRVECLDTIKNVIPEEHMMINVNNVFNDITKDVLKQLNKNKVFKAFLIERTTTNINKKESESRMKEGVVITLLGLGLGAGLTFPTLLTEDQKWIRLSAMPLLALGIASYLQGYWRLWATAVVFGKYFPHNFVRSDLKKEFKRGEACLLPVDDPYAMKHLRIRGIIHPFLVAIILWPICLFFVFYNDITGMPYAA